MPELPDVEVYKQHLESTALHQTIESVSVNDSQVLADSSPQEVLQTAVAHQADPEQFPDSFLIPRRQEGADCPDCAGTVEKIEVAGRTGYFCPQCQERPSKTK